MNLALSEGQRLKVAQLGPDFLILSAPAPGETEIGARALLTVSIDGSLREKRVILPGGIPKGTSRVAAIAAS